MRGIILLILPNRWVLLEVAHSQAIKKHPSIQPEKNQNNFLTAIKAYTIVPVR